MVKFVALGMILFIRNQCKTYLVTSDITQVLKRLTKYPPVEDIFEIINLANQCRDYLLSNNEENKPKLPELSLPHKSKILNFNSIKETGKNVINKIKNSALVEKFKPKKHSKNIDLAIMSISQWKDSGYTGIDESIQIVDTVLENLQRQIQKKQLDKNNAQEAIKLLQQLKTSLDNNI